jgi:hypothetical protein
VRLRNNNWILGVFVRAFPGKAYSEKLIAIKAISFIKVNRTVTLPNITVAKGKPYGDITQYNGG